MAVEQVAEIPSGQETRRGDIATRKGYRSPSRRALRFRLSITFATESEPYFNGIMDPEHDGDR